MESEIPYSIIYCSGEEPEHPCSQLLQTDGKGWCTPRNCAYPQEFLIKLHQPTSLSQLNILCHEYKIPNRMEIQIATLPTGDKPDASQVSFRRLGQITFDTNAHSSYAARELKKVTLQDVHAQLVRFKIHGVHSNNLNSAGQASIMSLSVTGTTTVGQGQVLQQQQQVQQQQQQQVSVASTSSSSTTSSSAPAADMAPLQQQQQQPHLLLPPTTTTNKNNFQQPHLRRNSAISTDPRIIASDMGVDLITAQRISELQTQKLSAIEREDYDDAKRLKAAVDRLKAQGIRIAALEGRKQSAVDVEDYDLAKQLKIEIERLRVGGGGNNSSIGSGRPSAAFDGLPSLQMTPPSSTHDNATDGNGNETSRAVAVGGGGGGGGGGGRRMASTPPRALASSSSQRGPMTTDTSSTPMSNIIINNGNATTPSGAARGSSTSWNAYEERPAVARGSYNINITEQEAAATMGATPLSPLAAPGDGKSNSNRKYSRALGSPVVIQQQQQPSSPSSLPLNQATPTVGINNNNITNDDDDDIDESLGPMPAGFPSDLPPPSPPLAGDMKNIEMLASVAGEYVSRAVFSKNWQLREAALNKISTDINNNNSNNNDSGGVFRMLCKAVLSKALRDRVATVVTAALELLKTAVQHTSSGRDVAAGVSDILPLLIERACDTNSRVKECAVDTIIYLVKVPETGLSQSHATAAFLKSPPAHLKTIGSTSPKMVAARVSLITRLLPIIGVASNNTNGSGFEVEGVMHYARGPLAHGNADVRYAAVSMVVELGRQSRGGGGVGVLQLLPADLNPKLKESIEKELSIAPSTSGGGGNKTAAAGGRRSSTAATAGAITSSKPRNSIATTNDNNNSSKKAPPRQSRQSPSMSSPPPPKSSPGAVPAISIPAYRPPTTSSPSPPSLPLPLPSPALAATSNPQLFEEALAGREECLGPWHPSVAEALANLAIVRTQQGQTEEALPLYQRALAVWEKVEGEQSVNVAHTLTDMAVIHLEGGRDAAGRPLLERALKIQEGLCGPDHPDVVAIRDVLEEQWGRAR